MRTIAIALAALAVALATAPAAAAQTRPAIQAEHPWIRATGPGAMTAAGYVVLSNRGKTPDRLLGGSTPAARSLSMHRSVESGGIMRMTPVKALPLAPGAAVAFKPGGYHLMLTGLTGPLKVGQKVPVTLTFERAGAMKLTFVVEQPGMAVPAGHDHDMAHMPGMH